jgi:hypothetical protein
VIKRGDRVRIKPDWADPGDDEIVFFAVDDESEGRVSIMAMLGLAINPIQVVTTEMVEIVVESAVSPENRPTS